MNDALLDNHATPAAESEHKVPCARTEKGLPPRGVPKTYLKAWLLVVLKDVELHGYEIMKMLKANFAVISDPGTIYRTLRQLERDGYIVSFWASQKQGPARRIYSLTEAGNSVLTMWTAGLEQYRLNLDTFFRLLTGKRMEDNLQDATPTKTRSLHP